ncbi:MAG: aldehyde dehydrogenase family protein [Thermoleophilaceae bacterium]
MTAPVQTGHPTGVEPIVRDAFYIGGEWVSATDHETVEVIDATTEEVVGVVSLGTPEDVDRAVAAARAGFEAWSQTSVTDRMQALEAITAGLQARAEEIAALVAREVGMPIGLSRMIQAGLPIMSFGSMVNLLDDLELEEQVGNSLIVREPVGVVGCITPWNYPLHQICAKVAPALAAGCATVVKPSEVTPLNAFILAEVIDDVGLPAGVFNLVPGYGPVVGEAMAAHPDVDMISFTGSTRAGRRVSEVASGSVKRVALELGGKSPYVILPDTTDMQHAVINGVGKCYLNSGQTCSALTRMLVPRERLQEVEMIAKAVAEATKIGDPFDEQSALGPLVSDAQRQRVRDYIQKGIDEGAKLVVGGPEQPDDLPSGYFVKPTVFSEVGPGMTIAQEEIFGPVLSIIPYDSEDEAAAIANDTIYGLAGGVWSDDPDHAKEFARRLRTGQVEVNAATFNPLAPFGGYKQSGHGRELGKFGLDEFFEIKAIQL